MQIEWKEYKNSGYFVSSTGLVKNRHGKIIKPASSKIYKYLFYPLSISGVKKSMFIHRLVAEVFIINPDNKPQVNHKDGNKLNNNVENLEWVTQNENVQHMYDLGLKTYKPLHYKGKFGKDHNRSKSVICVETGKKYGSMSEAARDLKIDNSSVSWAIKHNKPISGMHFEIG